MEAGVPPDSHQLSTLSSETCILDPVARPLGSCVSKTIPRLDWGCVVMADLVDILVLTQMSFRDSPDACGEPSVC